MDVAARELLRAVRGGISQVAFSRLLGFQGNAVAAWEGGHRFPGVQLTLRAAEKRRIDVREAFTAFHPRTAVLFDPVDLSPWLRGLLGTASNRELAARTGYSEHRIGRWLRGAAEPRLPQFLALIEALTGRLSDWVSALVPIDQVPSLAETHRARERMKRLVFHEPWTAAIVTRLGVLQPHAAPVERIAHDLAIDEAEVAAILAALLDAGVVAATDDGYRVVAPLTVDAAPTSQQIDGLRAHWASVSHTRVQDARPTDRFHFNVFNVSQQDLGRIHELQASTYREIRGIVAASQPAEATAVYVAHLFTLG